jgi:hypothetical protein
MRSRALRGGFALASVVLFGVAACGGTSDGERTESQAASPTPEVTGQQQQVDRPSIELLPAKTTRGVAENLDPASKAAAARPGTCGDLRDTGKPDRTFIAGDCSSSAYRVTQVEVMPKSCPTDSDQVYFRGDPGKGTFYTLCLDLDWRVGKCLTALDKISAVSPCTESDPRSIRALSVRYGEGLSNECGENRRGVEHKDRKFVVCINASK